MSSADLEVDRAAVIRSPGPDPPRLQLGQDIRVRVAEQVPAAAGNDRQAWLHGVEEAGTGRAPASVMGDFQDVRAEVAVREHDLRLGLDVAGQQHAAPAALDAEDDR